MNSEQQALKRLAETRKQVNFSYGAHNIFFSGKGIEVERFKNAIGEAIRLGNAIESGEAVSDEIKLGWYRSETEERWCPRDIEVVAIRGDMACVWSVNGCSLLPLDRIRKREYMGTERPPKGRWVDFDPATFTCDMLPIKARMRDKWDDEWTEKRLFGYTVDNDSFPFLSDVGDDYKFCQIWEEE